MKTIEELRDYKIVEDKKLLPVEVETYFSISGEDESRVHISTGHKQFIEQALKIDDFIPTRYYFTDDGNLCYLEGYLPISHLRLKVKGNNDKNYISTVVRN